MKKRNKKIKHETTGPSRKDQFFTFKGDFSMTTLERLQKDSSELDQFVEKLTNEGREDLIKKVQIKKQFIDDKVKQLIEATA